MKTYIYPRDFTHYEPEQEKIQFIEERAGKVHRPPYHIDLNIEKFSEQIEVIPGACHKYASPIALQEDYDRYAVAKVIKAFLTSDHHTQLPFERLEMATALVKRYQVEEMLDAQEMIKTANAWWTYLDRSYEIEKVYRKYPIRYFWGDRLFETIVDLLLVTNQGMILFQNSGFSGGQKKWSGKAKELGDWFHLSKLALQEVFERSDIQAFVHFVMNGAVMEVNTKKLSYQGKLGL